MYYIPVYVDRPLCCNIHIPVPYWPKSFHYSTVDHTLGIQTHQTHDLALDKEFLEKQTSSLHVLYGNTTL